MAKVAYIGSDSILSDRPRRHGSRIADPLRDRNRPLQPVARGAHAGSARVPRLAGIEPAAGRAAVDPLLRPAGEPEQGAPDAGVPRGVLARQVRAHQRALLL